jgi:hypothetical protein
MKVTWEEHDIQPGQQIGKESIRERQMIGFLAAEHSEKRFVIVSLSDGMTQPPMGRKELSIWLTEGGWLPASVL